VLGRAVAVNPVSAAGVEERRQAVSRLRHFPARHEAVGLPTDRPALERILSSRGRGPRSGPAMPRSLSQLGAAHPYTTSWSEGCDSRIANVFLQENLQLDAWPPRHTPGQS
jgi:hypothetical protein